VQHGAACKPFWPAIALQVTANPELRGVVARGANQLPTAVLQKAMRPLYGGPLNFVAFSRAVESLDGWYRDRGILGQVGVCGGVGKLAYKQCNLISHLAGQTHCCTRHCHAYTQVCPATRRPFAPSICWSISNVHKMLTTAFAASALSALAMLRAAGH
jgi:hypothetical protein